MFLRYAYRKENGKLDLYLYKTANFEFAKDYDAKNEKEEASLEEEASHYIKEKKLPLSFDKVYIIMDNKIVKTLSKEQLHLEERVLTEKKIDEESYIVTVKMENKEERISLLNYLIGALFTNTTFSLHKEALKALVILYRTFAFDCLSQKGYIEASNAFVIYRNPFIYKFTYLEKFQENYDLFKEAVLETEGRYLLSDGKPIKPYVHLVSSGYTKENQIDKYLVSKESLWDMKAQNYLQHFFFSYSDLATKLSLTHSSNKQVNPNYSKKEIAILLALPSENFTCIEEKDGMTFISQGIGNDLGLSLFGANYLAEQGLNYAQILSYYFQNIILYQK